MDWNKLKAEYIAGGTSYRKLAEKYKDEGVTFDNLKNIAVKEGWAKLKEQAKDKATTKMVDAIAKDISNKSLKIDDVADKLLDKICDLLEAVDIADSQTIKQCTSALKDIKDIKGVKSEIDLKEQNARIDKLRKEIESDQLHDEKPYGVVLMPPIMPTIVPPSEEETDG